MTGSTPDPLRSQLIQRIRELSCPLSPIPTDATAQPYSLRKIRAVLFDVYGTLLVSGAGEVGTTKDVPVETDLSACLTAAGFSGDTEEAGICLADRLRREIHGLHEVRREEGVEYPEVDILKVWQEVLYALRAEGLLRGNVTGEAVQRLAVEYECLVNPVWPMPGMVETLHGLRDRGIKLGLVSNAQFFTPLLFAAFGYATWEELGIVETCCAWSYELLEAKPSPNLFEKALQVLEESHGIRAEEVLYIGNDMWNDVWGAAKMGMPALLFAGDTRSLRWREDLPICASLQPSGVAVRLIDLLAWFD